MAAPGGEGWGAIGVVFVLRGCGVFASGFLFGLASRCAARRPRPAGLVARGRASCGAVGVAACGAVRPLLFALRPGRGQGHGVVSLWLRGGWRSFGIGKRRAVVRRRRGAGGLRARFRCQGRGRLGHRRGAGCEVAGTSTGSVQACVVGWDRGAGRGLGGRGHRRRELVSRVRSGGVSAG